VAAGAAAAPGDCPRTTVGSTFGMARGDSVLAGECAPSELQDGVPGEAQPATQPRAARQASIVSERKVAGKVVRQ
jgi:hypothetical protein